MISERDAIRFHEMLEERIQALSWDRDFSVVKCALEAIKLGQWSGAEESPLAEINEIVNVDDAAVWGVSDIEVLRNCFRNCIALTLSKAESEHALWIEKQQANASAFEANKKALNQSAPPPSVDHYFQEVDDRLQTVGLTAFKVDQVIGYDLLALKEAISENFDLFLESIRMKRFTLEQISEVPAHALKAVMENDIIVGRFLKAGVSIAMIAEHIVTQKGVDLMKGCTALPYIRKGVTLDQLMALSGETQDKVLEYRNFLKYKRETWDSFIAQL